MGGAYFVSAAQAAFLGKLLETLAGVAPQVDPSMVILTGATQIRTAFAQSDVPFIIYSYMQGIKVSFAIAVAGVGVAFLFSVASPWKRLPMGAATGGAA